MSQRMQKEMTKGNVVSSRLEMKAFMSHLPLRLKRITTGLVLAALIVGASRLMRIETRSRLFGYPTLAILCL